MKKLFSITIAMVFVVTISSCAAPPDRYNTQKGAAIGAGFGALTGQIIGHSTRSTLLGAAVGGVLGSLVGNTVDQDYQYSREANYQSYQTGREAAYAPPYRRYYGYRTAPYDTIPAYYNNTQPNRCRKVIRRTIENGRVISETMEEICEGDRYSREY